MADLIDGLQAGRSTNMSDGLQTGLKVLADRQFNVDRAVAIMLMSDGKQTRGCDAAEVAVGDVPVYAFGFGADHDPRVLSKIAKNSKNGMFSVVPDVEVGLRLAFSQCLAGLLTIVAQDLKLKFQSLNATAIQKVAAGSYPQKRGDKPVSVTISFGDLYSREVRKVIFDLALAEVQDEQGDQEIGMVTSPYRIPQAGGKDVEGNPGTVFATRTGRAILEPLAPEIEMEQARLQTAKMVREAMAMAEREELDDANVVDAQNALEDLAQRASPVVDMLRTELEQFQDLIASQDMYDTQGRAYALSLLTSHDRQRFAARGDVEKMQLFAMPRMDKYLLQAKAFDEDPTVPLIIVK